MRSLCRSRGQHHSAGSGCCTATQLGSLSWDSLQHSLVLVQPRPALAWTLSESEIEKGQTAFLVEAPPRLSGLGWQHRLRQFSNPLGEPAVPTRPQPLASAGEA